MKMLCCDIQEKEDRSQISSFFCAITRKTPREYVRGYRFDVTLTDKSGKIELTYWGGRNLEAVTEVYNSFNIEDVVWVSGVVGSYKDEKVISINEGYGEIRRANSEEYDLDDFIPKTNQNISEMWTKLVQITESVGNAHLKNLLNTFFGDADFVDGFKKAPAAMYYHHACAGGLLEHTWEVLRYCETIADVHPSLDGDLLFTGAILHDIGKIEEFKVGATIKSSRRGVLTGHISIAANSILTKIVESENFPPILRDKLIHMILSHHGKNEWGTFVEPKFPEAAALHIADLMGARVSQYIRAKKDAVTDDFSIYSKKLRSPIFLE